MRASHSDKRGTTGLGRCRAERGCSGCAGVSGLPRFRLCHAEPRPGRGPKCCSAVGSQRSRGSYAIPNPHAIPDPHAVSNSDAVRHAHAVPNPDTVSVTHRLPNSAALCDAHAPPYPHPARAAYAVANADSVFNAYAFSDGDLDTDASALSNPYALPNPYPLANAYAVSHAHATLAANARSEADPHANARPGAGGSRQRRRAHPARLHRHAGHRHHSSRTPGPDGARSSTLTRALHDCVTSRATDAVCTYALSCAGAQDCKRTRTSRPAR